MIHVSDREFLGNPFEIRGFGHDFIMSSTIRARLLARSRSRFAPWIILGSAGLLTVGGWGAGMFESAAPGRPTGAASPAAGPGRTKHYVTPRQLAESNQMAGREAKGLQGTAHDGE